MNIDDTKAIPMTEILGRLDIHPKRLTNNKAWYLSPLRQEKTASFQVDVKWRESVPVNGAKVYRN